MVALLCCITFAFCRLTHASDVPLDSTSILQVHAVCPRPCFPLSKRTHSESLWPGGTATRAAPVTSESLARRRPTRAWRSHASPEVRGMVPRRRRARMGLWAAANTAMRRSLPPSATARRSRPASQAKPSTDPASSPAQPPPILLRDISGLGTKGKGHGDAISRGEALY